MQAVVPYDSEIYVINVANDNYYHYQDQLEFCAGRCLLALSHKAYVFGGR